MLPELPLEHLVLLLGRKEVEIAGRDHALALLGEENRTLREEVDRLAGALGASAQPLFGGEGRNG
jgi:hypothetical protein